MKLLLIGPQVHDLSQIRNFSGVWSFYLPRELRRMGVDVRFMRPIHQEPWDDHKKIAFFQDHDFSDADHVLALGIRYWDRLPKECGYTVMRKLKNRSQGGVLAQIHDGATRQSPCDVTFHIKIDNKLPARGLHNDNHWIGWAADEQLLTPDQNPHRLQILIDHAQLEGGEPEDWTATISERAISFAKSRLWEDQWHNISVRRIMDGEVRSIAWGPDHNKAIQVIPQTYKPFARQTIPFPAIAREYRQAHVFMVTHPESVGLSVVECAMAGALPVVPQGAVSTPMLNLLRTLRYSSLVVPWGEVLAMISPELSRQKALANSWSTVAERITSYLERRS